MKTPNLGRSMWKADQYVYIQECVLCWLIYIDSAHQMHTSPVQTKLNECLSIIFCYKSYYSTVHFCRITSVYQPTNAHIISHKTPLKHSDMFRSCQFIIRELCSLLKLCYSIHNSVGICKRGVVAAYHVVYECVVEQWLGVLRMLSTERQDRNMSESSKEF